MGRTTRNCVQCCLLLLLLATTAAQKVSWKTLRGNPPLVVAKGGLSGVFPDSSDRAYQFVAHTSSPSTALWCDIQLTNNGVGICLPSLTMEAITDITKFYPDGNRTYSVNGEVISGWFSVSFKSADLHKIYLKQESRLDAFDGISPVVPVKSFLSQYSSSSVWLNVQYNSFYRQFNLDMVRYVLSTTENITIHYISSPEVNFLTSIFGKVSMKTKLVFRFLDEMLIEPSTNQTYGALLKNLTFVKTFASGILVPKNYIWPVTNDNYLLPYTSVVSDAHKAGLEVYTGEFANDILISYNYSADPLAEYLSFTSNGHFSVDGVLTVFPNTASQAIGCFSNLSKETDHAHPLVIAYNGASGDYPGCTDISYQKAVADGADVLDCPVQVTKDGILICMSSIDLMDDTNVGDSRFAQPVVFKDLKGTRGVFTFNLSWNDIVKNLKPKILNPYINLSRYRNPRYENAGNFMTLSGFLAFCKGKDLSGIMITVEHAAFMADTLGFDVVDAVKKAITESGYDKKTAQRVMIQSTNSSVLVKFKQQTIYKLVYMIREEVRDAVSSSLADIKTFADAVSIDKESVFRCTGAFLINQSSHLVQSLHSAGLAVYVYLLENEDLDIPLDFFNEPTQQIIAYVECAGVDGVITSSPQTAHRYKVNSCINMGKSSPLYMQTLQPGKLLSMTTSQQPSVPQLPLLTDSNVTEPPLPEVSKTNTKNPSSQAAITMWAAVSVLIPFLAHALLI